jgi:hypothetical protein
VRITGFVEFLACEGLQPGNLDLDELIDRDDVTGVVELMALDVLPFAGLLRRTDLGRFHIGNVEPGQPHADGGPETRPAASDVEVKRDGNAGVDLQIGVLGKRRQPTGGLGLATRVIDGLVRTQERGHADVLGDEEMQPIEKGSHPAELFQQVPGAFAAVLQPVQ